MLSLLITIYHFQCSKSIRKYFKNFNTNNILSINISVFSLTVLVFDKQINRLTFISESKRVHIVCLIIVCLLFATSISSAVTEFYIRHNILSSKQNLRIPITVKNEPPKMKASISSVFCFVVENTFYHIFKVFLFFVFLYIAVVTFESNV